MKKNVYLFLFLLICNSGLAQNLIINGGFETATGPMPLGTSLTSYPTFTDNWSAVNTDGEFIFSNTLAHTGTGFLSTLQNGGGNPLTFWLGAPAAFGGYDRQVQIVTVAPSTSYELQYWYRSGNGLRYGTYGAGQALIQVEEFAPTTVAIDSFSVSTTATWQQATHTFTTGAFTTQIAILFSGFNPNNNNVDVWIDDVDLHEYIGEGINEINASINIYPNPVTSELHINLNYNEPTQLTIYDIASRIITQQSFTKTTTINCENYPKGMYFYELRNADGVMKQGRLVKD